jgi:hypothetical protein
MIGLLPFTRQSTAGKFKNKPDWSICFVFTVNPPNSGFLPGSAYIEKNPQKNTSLRKSQRKF